MHARIESGPEFPSAPFEDLFGSRIAGDFPLQLFQSKWANRFSKVRYAYPSPIFRGIYLWDTAFISQVWRTWDVQTAEDVNWAALSRADASGRLPHFSSVYAKSEHTQPPVMAAQRVPPSAWMTSQSTVICRSPSALRSTPARSARPINRWISAVRPPCLPACASRRIRTS